MEQSLFWLHDSVLSCTQIKEAENLQRCYVMMIDKYITNSNCYVKMKDK